MIAVESRLVSVLDDISREVACGNWRSAARLADCARRLAPHDMAVQLLCSRVFLQHGAAREAEQCVAAREDPDALVVRAEALRMRGAWIEAAALCRRLLQAYCVGSVAALARVSAGSCGDAPGLPGWVGVDDRLRLTGEVQAGAPLTISWADHSVLVRAEARTACVPRLSSFVYELPGEFSGTVTLDSRGRELLGSGLHWPPGFAQVPGWVVFEDEVLQGEVRLGWANTLPLTIVFRCRGGGGLVTPSVPSSGAVERSPFTFPSSDLPGNFSSVEVSVLLPSGNRQPLLGSPVELRGSTHSPRVERPRQRRAAASTNRSRLPIDVVVPVYAGYDETLLCLESVLSSTNRERLELIVVNDASPDPRLPAALRALHASGRIALLENPVNLGFPATANRGIGCHPDRDVVLLNSDTRVFGDWLDRIRCAAYSAVDVGTATPFGRAASITSYPGPAQSCGADDDCAIEEAQRIDRIARCVNAGRTVDLPTGVGFCMYLRRDCLDEVGDLDQKSFDRGYGEENDFCLRARQLGWRHVAATDLFVWHQGGRSFSQTKEVLMARNARVLNQRYPAYAALVSEFIASDALRTARRAIDMERLLETVVDPVLLLTVDLTGGVARHVRERISKLVAAGRTVFIVRCAQDADAAEPVTVSVECGLRDTVELTFDWPHWKLPATCAAGVVAQRAPRGRGNSPFSGRGRAVARSRH